MHHVLLSLLKIPAFGRSVGIVVMTKGEGRA